MRSPIYAKNAVFSELLFSVTPMFTLSFLCGSFCGTNPAARLLLPMIYVYERLAAVVIFFLSIIIAKY